MFENNIYQYHSADAAAFLQCNDNSQMIPLYFVPQTVKQFRRSYAQAFPFFLYDFLP